MYAEDNVDVEEDASAYPPEVTKTRFHEEELTTHQVPSYDTTVISSFEINGEKQELSKHQAAGMSSKVIRTLNQWKRFSEADKQKLQEWYNALPGRKQAQYGRIDFDPNPDKMNTLQRLMEKNNLLEDADDAETGQAFFSKHFMLMGRVLSEECLTMEDVISWWNFQHLDLDALLYEAYHPARWMDEEKETIDDMAVGVFDDLDEIL